MSTEPFRSVDIQVDMSYCLKLLAYAMKTSAVIAQCYRAAACNGLDGVSFTKLQNSDSCVILPIGFGIVHDFSWACSFVITVRIYEMCTSRQLCVLYWSTFASTIQFSPLRGNTQKHMWGTDLLWTSRVQREVVSCGVFFSFPETIGLSAFARCLRFVSSVGSLIFPACVAAEHKRIWAGFELASSGMVCILQLQQ